MAGGSAASSSKRRHDGERPERAPEKRGRFVWSHELHEKFVGAVFDVGLRDATPRAAADGLPSGTYVDEASLEQFLDEFRAARPDLADVAGSSRVAPLPPAASDSPTSSRVSDLDQSERLVETELKAKAVLERVAVRLKARVETLRGVVRALGATPAPPPPPPPPLDATARLFEAEAKRLLAESPPAGPPPAAAVAAPHESKTAPPPPRATPPAPAPAIHRNMQELRAMHQSILHTKTDQLALFGTGPFRGPTPAVPAATGPANVLMPFSDADLDSFDVDDALFDFLEQDLQGHGGA